MTRYYQIKTRFIDFHGFAKNHSRREREREREEERE
jgi:hypothetical protein